MFAISGRRSLLVTGAIALLVSQGCAKGAGSDFLHAENLHISADTCRGCDPFSISASRNGNYIYTPLQPTPYVGKSAAIANAFSDLDSSDATTEEFRDSRFPDGLVVTTGDEATAAVLAMKQGGVYPATVMHAMERVVDATTSAVSEQRLAYASKLSALPLKSVVVSTSYLNNSCAVFDVAIKSDDEATIRTWNPRRGLKRRILKMNVPFAAVEKLVNKFQLAYLWDQYPIHWHDAPSLRVGLLYGTTNKTIVASDVTMAPKSLVSFVNVIDDLVIEAPSASLAKAYCAPYRRTYPAE